MSGATPFPIHPSSLPVGTLVGRWRVVDWVGRGTHGAVYRAVPVDKEHAAPVALKLALLPRNPGVAVRAPAQRAARRRWPWLVTAAAGLAVTASVGWGMVEKLAEKSSVFSSATGGQSGRRGHCGAR